MKVIDFKAIRILPADVNSTSSLIESKIEGGRDVANEVVSFLAFIEIKHTSGSDIISTCTGFVATNVRIVSLARCLYYARYLSKSGFIVKAWVGVDMENGKRGQTYVVEEIHIPDPFENLKNLKISFERIDSNDIAVMVVNIYSTI